MYATLLVVGLWLSWLTLQSEPARTVMGSRWPTTTESILLKSDLSRLHGYQEIQEIVRGLYLFLSGPPALWTPPTAVRQNSMTFTLTQGIPRKVRHPGDYRCKRRCLVRCS